MPSRFAPKLNRLGRAAMWVTAAAVFVACAQRAGPVTDSTPSGASGAQGSNSEPVEGINWNGPFGGNGIQLADEAALVSLDPTFPYYMPKTSDPTQIFAPSEPDGSAGKYAIYFVLDDPKYGSVWIGESAPDLDTDAERQTFYKQSVAANGQPGVSGTAEIVTIRDGITALLGTSDAGVSTISWVDGGTELFVLGRTLTRSQALHVANSI